MVSIVLPVYNAASTVGRAVASCLEQTYTDLELIVVDDGSVDGTARVLGEFCDSRMRVVAFEEQRGVAIAAEAGRNAASGDLIARMDADDFAYPARIARQVEFLRSNPDIGGCGTAVRVVGAPEADPGRGFGEHVRWLNGLVTLEVMAAERFVDSPIANPSSMVKASVLESVGGHHDPAWAEDYDLWLRLLNAGHQLCNLPDVLLDWYDSGGRLTRSDPRYSAEMFSRAKAHYLAKLPKVREFGVEIAAAGPIGKRIARHLSEEGVTAHCFWEVNTKRVGERIGGIEVRGHENFERRGNVLLGAVGLPGARERVRKLALDVGYREGVDFFCVA